MRDVQWGLRSIHPECVMLPRSLVAECVHEYQAHAGRWVKAPTQYRPDEAWLQPLQPRLRQAQSHGQYHRLLKYLHVIFLTLLTFLFIDR